MWTSSSSVRWALIAVPLAVVAATGAPRRGENLVRNGGFEADGEWSAYGPGGFTLDDTVAHAGRRSLRVDGATIEASGGAKQVITLDPPIEHPFRVSGWSRAENAVVGRDYNLYLDLHYDDGTPLWGQIARFEPGTHGWQRSELIFPVAKPVRTIEVHILFRQAQGTVWFDDVAVELAPFELRGLRVLPGVFGGRGLAVSGSASLPCAWNVSVEGDAGRVWAESAAALPIRARWAGDRAGDYRVHVTARDDLLGESVEETRTVRLGESSAGPGYAVWTADSMTRVLPHHLPPEGAGPPLLELSLARHEYESAQLVLLAAPGTTLGPVQLDLGDLRGETGMIPAANLSWHQVGYVRLEVLRGHPAEPDAAPGWWPDPLLPVKAATVPDGFAQPFWLTVYVPPEQAPGTYRGEITIRPAQAPATVVPLTVRVHDVALPVRGHLKTAFALMDGFLERVYGKPLPAELRRRYGDYCLQHRLNPDDISRTDPPAIEDLRHYRDRGLNAFNVLNMVEPRGNRTWVCWSPLEVYTPTFKQELIARLDPYVEALRREGLTEWAYIYTFDERGEEFWPVMREYFGMVKERYPEIPTFTTAYLPLDPDRLTDLNIDWVCPLTPRYDRAAADRCRAAGKQVWAYVCLGPGYPYANWLADNPLIEARVIGWQAWQERMDGFLYWGLNIWSRPHNDRPIDPDAGPLLDWSITTGGDHAWLHGDGELLYAGPDGPIGSIRLANIRDGLDDYELLHQLAERAGQPAAEALCERVTRRLTDYTRDPRAVRAAREALFSALTEQRR